MQNMNSIASRLTVMIIALVLTHVATVAESKFYVLNNIREVGDNSYSGTTVDFAKKKLYIDTDDCDYHPSSKRSTYERETERVMLRWDDHGGMGNSIDWKVPGQAACKVVKVW